MASRDGSFVLWLNGLPFTGQGLDGSQNFVYWRNGLPASEPSSGLTPLNGALSVTLATLSVASVGTNPIVGTATPTLAALTVTSVGTNPIVGAAAPTLDAVTTTATGVIPNFGAESTTLGDVTLASTGSGLSPIFGTLAATLADLSESSAGLALVQGTSTPTLDAVTCSSSGNVTGRAGTLFSTLDAVTSTSAGTVSESGALSVTLAALTTSATGTVLNPIVGTEVGTLDALLLAATGLVLNPIHATFAKTLSALTTTSGGTTATLGNLTATLDALTCTASIGWPAVEPLRPDIDDDNWGGALTYAWTQESGPALATIVDPSSKWTNVRFPDIDGVYVFRLTVTRELDALVGTSLVRVRVYASLIDSPGAGVPGGAPGGPTGPTGEPWLPRGVEIPFQDDVSVESGQVIITTPLGSRVALLNSVQISESVGQPSTCSFKMYGDTVVIGSNVTVTRFGERLFGGVCLSVQVTDVEGHVFTTASLTGYAWHFSRTMITKNYLKTNIEDIVADIVANAIGGVTVGIIEQGLGKTSVVFTDTYIDAALTQLTKLVAGLHWYVDSFNAFYFVRTEIGADPAAITNRHPTLRDLTVTHTLAQAPNRIIMYYGDALPAVSEKVLADLPIDPVITFPPRGLAVGRNIQVDSLAGYDPKGGNVLIGGNRIHYAGLESVRTTPMFGAVLVSMSVKGAEGGEFGATPHSGPFTLSNPPIFGYWTSIVTPDGETPPSMVVGGLPGLKNGTITPMRWNYNSQSFQLLDPVDVHESAFEITVQLPKLVESAGHFVLGDSGSQGVFSAGASSSGGTSPILDRINQINIYRNSDEPTGPGSTAGNVFLVGSVPNTGGTLLDSRVRLHLEPVTEPKWKYTLRKDGSYPWDPPNTYYLTGCTGIDSPIEKGTSGMAFVVADDKSAQAILGAALGGSGVVEGVEHGPANITTLESDGTTTITYTTTEDAMILALAFLKKTVAISTTLTCTVEDHAARAGQTIDMSMPAPYGDASLKIQQSSISGFEAFVPHRLNITAGTEAVTLDDLIKHILPDPPVVPPPQFWQRIGKD